MAYRIVTDATFDLDDHLLNDLPPVTVIPMDIIVGETSYLYGPGGNIGLDQFYALLREGNFASTSQITPLRFETAFREVLEEGLDLLYIGLTTGLSGTFQNALLAKEQLLAEYPEREILCIDPLCASAGMGFLVREALVKQKEGLGLKELASWILERRLHVCHWFSVDTFEHLKHGGRISAAAAAIGSVLHIKPLLRVDEEGRLDVVGKPRGTNQAIALKIRHMEETWTSGDGNFVLVANGDNKEGAKIFKERLRERFPGAQIEETSIGPVIGSHTGPGMLAVLFWGSSR
ncbi:MAG: DegV family protein [Lachnospiraceae bacterium]|nr:DegV family protein [Lachnospiraceae bacterium]